MKKILALVLSILVIMCFVGCTDSGKPEDSSSVEDQSSKAESFPMIDSVIEGNEFCAVILLGGFKSYEEYKTEIKQSEYLDDVPQLESITENEFISTGDGVETFAISPATSVKSIKVYKHSIDYSGDFATGKKGDLLYESDEANVIVIKCNMSDLFPDNLISITDADGKVYEFNLQTSLKDGKVTISGEVGDFIKDVTKY